VQPGWRETAQRCGERRDAPCSTMSRLLRRRSAASRSARLSNRKRRRAAPTFCGLRNAGSNTNSGCTAVAPSSAASSAGLSCRRRPLRSHHTEFAIAAGAAAVADVRLRQTSELFAPLKRAGERANAAARHAHAVAVVHDRRSGAGRLALASSGAQHDVRRTTTMRRRVTSSARRSEQHGRPAASA